MSSEENFAPARDRSRSLISQYSGNSSIQRERSASGLQSKRAQQLAAAKKELEKYVILAKQGKGVRATTVQARTVFDAYDTKKRGVLDVRDAMHYIDDLLYITGRREDVKSELRKAARDAYYKMMGLPACGGGEIPESTESTHSFTSASTEERKDEHGEDENQPQVPNSASQREIMIKLQILYEAFLRQCTNLMDFRTRTEAEDDQGVAFDELVQPWELDDFLHFVNVHDLRDEDGKVVIPYSSSSSGSVRYFNDLEDELELKKSELITLRAQMERKLNEIKLIEVRMKKRHWRTAFNTTKPQK